MALAAGWGEGDPVNRDDNPLWGEIECIESRAPFNDSPDLRSVAVLYVTREEASAIRALTDELQAARASGADQFLVRKPVGYGVTASVSTGTTGSAGGAGATAVVQDPLWLFPGALVQSCPLPSGWTIDFDAGNNRYLLYDETRSVRAELYRRLSTGDWMVLSVVKPAKPTEPTTAKPVNGDAARFAGIDFSD